MGAQTSPKSLHDIRVAENQTPKLETSAAGTVNLEAYETVVFADIPATGLLALVLPPAAEAPHKRFLIFCENDAGGTSVTVDDDGNSKFPFTLQTLTAVDDYVVIDNVGGFGYIPVADVTT